MSLNWVMLEGEQGYVKLPSEREIFRSVASGWTTFALTTPKTYPGNDSISIHCDRGIACLTNQRVLYLPSKPTPEFKSFSAPLLNLHDTHVILPWFGPNGWHAVVQPVPGGNLPASNSGIELKLTFKEGGATDFHFQFERIKERMQQAVEAARESGDLRQSQRAFMNGVNMDAVHLDELPSYVDSRRDRVAPNDELPPEPTTQPTLITSNQPPHQMSRVEEAPIQPPSDAPPGYEETQQQSVQQALDRRLSGH